MTDAPVFDGLPVLESTKDALGVIARRMTGRRKNSTERRPAVALNLANADRDPRPVGESAAESPNYNEIEKDLGTQVESGRNGTTFPTSQITLESENPPPGFSIVATQSLRARCRRQTIASEGGMSTMPRFRKKASSSGTPTNIPPLAPTPPTAEYTRQRLSTFRLWKKDRRALAASSSAVALSIISPSCDPTDSAPDEPGLSKESVWKAAYGAARIAVDVAKDSFDMFPPVKAVLVALSVLMKNCDVCPPPASRSVGC